MEDDYVVPFDPASLLPFSKELVYEEGHKAMVNPFENSLDFLKPGNKRPQKRGGTFSARS